MLEERAVQSRHLRPQFFVSCRCGHLAAMGTGKLIGEPYGPPKNGLHTRDRTRGCRSSTPLEFARTLPRGFAGVLPICNLPRDCPIPHTVEPTPVDTLACLAEARVDGVRLIPRELPDIFSEDRESTAGLLVYINPGDDASSRLLLVGDSNHLFHSVSHACVSAIIRNPATSVQD